jgi:hypothetical protein
MIACMGTRCVARPCEKSSCKLSCSHSDCVRCKGVLEEFGGVCVSSEVLVVYSGRRMVYMPTIVMGIFAEIPENEYGSCIQHMRLEFIGRYQVIMVAAALRCATGITHTSHFSSVLTEGIRSTQQFCRYSAVIFRVIFLFFLPFLASSIAPKQALSSGVVGVGSSNSPTNRVMK